MCGRYSLIQSAEAIASSFELKNLPDLSPRYNIAPSQSVATVLQKSERKLKWMQWGLIPSWAKDSKIGYKLINARAETISEKPAFRSAFKSRRCSIVADGFYEWQKVEKRKQPYYFQRQDEKPFAFAGLWEIWQPQTEEALFTCTIVTTTANDLMQPIHERMPVILTPDSYDQWLDPNATDLRSLQDLLQPCASEVLKAFPISSTVNNSANDTPDCIVPA
jgi:putative SOS response-associated peptidase YedK